MMNDICYRILYFLELEHKIDMILKELKIDETSLADIIIDLDNKELIILDNKKWILTQKGKGVLNEKIEGLIKKFKIDYMYGNINKEEFEKKRKDILDSSENDIIMGDISSKKEKKNCPKCGKENKPGSKYCFKCGEPLNK